MSVTTERSRETGNRATLEAVSDLAPPGRSCPLHYLYSPTSLARAAEFDADTLYVVGGLYGNPIALDELLTRDRCICLYTHLRAGLHACRRNGRRTRRSHFQ